MSNNSNTLIVFASILLGAILATGLLALNPSMIGNAKAEMYYDEYDDTYYNDDNNRHGYDSNYNYQDDNRYSYDNNHQKKISNTNNQKINCIISNINVNGVDITQIPQDNNVLAAANEGAGGADAGTANTHNGNGLADRINFERNLVNICVNVNDNDQIKVSPPEE